MKKGDVFDRTPHSAVMAEFKRSLSGVGDLVFDNPEDFHSIRIYNRGPQDVLTVVKRFGSDGGVEVLFGSGVDFVSSLLSASAACKNGRWRVDKPYEKR